MKKVYYYTFCIRKKNRFRNLFKILHCRASCLLSAFVWLVLSYGFPSQIKFIGCDDLPEDVNFLRKN